MIGWYMDVSSATLSLDILACLKFLELDKPYESVIFTCHNNCGNNSG